MVQKEISQPFTWMFLAVFLGYNQYSPGGFMVFCGGLLCPGGLEV